MLVLHARLRGRVVVVVVVVAIHIAIHEAYAECPNTGGTLRLV